MKRRAFLPLLMLTGCATAPVPAGTNDLVLHYLRTNQDGSEPEHVIQFRRSPNEVAVYKWVSPCTTAAYVTATMDDRVVEGREFVAGKVAKDGRQARFGTLTLDPKRSALLVDIAPPGSKRVQARHDLKSRPYLLYDFDFADLNAFLQVHRPRDGFEFDLPVIWPGDDAMFRDLGRLKATPLGDETRGGRNVLRYRLDVDGPHAATGALLIDAARFFIVEAELGLPNHAEYRDFKLVLEREELGGQAAFDALTRSQYARCPA